MAGLLTGDASIYNSGASTTTSRVQPIPTGVALGEMLLAVVRTGRTSSGLTITLTTVGGSAWTRIADTKANSTVVDGAVFVKVAGAAEVAPGATATFTTNVANRMALVVARTTGFDSAAIIAAGPTAPTETWLTNQTRTTVVHPSVSVATAPTVLLHVASINVANPPAATLDGSGSTGDTAFVNVDSYTPGMTSVTAMYVGTRDNLVTGASGSSTLTMPNTTTSTVRLLSLSLSLPVIFRGSSISSTSSSSSPVTGTARRAGSTTSVTGYSGSISGFGARRGSSTSSSGSTSPVTGRADRRGGTVSTTVSANFAAGLGVRRSAVVSLTGSSSLATGLAGRRGAAQSSSASQSVVRGASGRGSRVVSVSAASGLAVGASSRAGAVTSTTGSTSDVSGEAGHPADLLLTDWTVQLTVQPDPWRLAEAPDPWRLAEAPDPFALRGDPMNVYATLTGAEFYRFDFEELTGRDLTGATVSLALGCTTGPDTAWVECIVEPERPDLLACRVLIGDAPLGVVGSYTPWFKLEFSPQDSERIVRRGERDSITIR